MKFIQRIMYSMHIDVRFEMVIEEQFISSMIFWVVHSLVCFGLVWFGFFSFF